MHGPTIDALLRRLDRLERENTRWKSTGAATLIVIAALAVMGQATTGKVAKVLEAERFVLRDVHGKNRGEFTVTDDGTSALWLNDEDGKIGAALSVIRGGPRRLELADKHGTKAEVTVRPEEGDARVLLYDKTSMPRAAMEVLPDGRPIVQIADKDGKTRAELLLGPNDTPFLSFYDRNKERKFIAGVGVAKDGSVILALDDREQQSRAELSVPRGGLPRLRFLDKDENVIWRTPELGKVPKPEQ